MAINIGKINKKQQIFSTPAGGPGGGSPPDADESLSGWNQISIWKISSKINFFEENIRKFHQIFNEK